jgi:enoyl-CoA hydratase/carnithine racemase
MLSDLRVLDYGGVLLVELARPTKKNAITREMYVALTEQIRALGQRDDIRVMVICGEGPDFCAGNDLRDFLEGDEDQRGVEAMDFLSALAQMPRPLVVAVEGLAIGIGTTLLLHADVVVAGESARFRLPFVDLGLSPEGCSSLLLAQRCGYLRAAELLMLGEEFSSQRAVEVGLVTRLVATGEARHEALALAGRLAHKPVQALDATRRLLREALDSGVQAALEREFLEFRNRLRSREAQEKMAAILSRGTERRQDR